MNKSPSRKVNEIDNRGSHFYLAMYWIEALAAQDKSPELKAQFTPAAKAMQEAEKTITDDLIKCQGKPCDIGGYYRPDVRKLRDLMQPSPTFNLILSSIAKWRPLRKPKWTKVDKIQPDASLRLQNAKVVMIKGFIRVVVDKWAVLKKADADCEFEVKTDKDIAAVEYELAG